MEKSKMSHNVRMKHEDDFFDETQTRVSLCACNYRGEDSQRTTTLTDNIKKKTTKNEGSSIHEDSCIGLNHAHMFPNVSSHFTQC